MSNEPPHEHYYEIIDTNRTINSVNRLPEKTRMSLHSSISPRREKPAYYRQNVQLRRSFLARNSRKSPRLNIRSTQRVSGDVSREGLVRQRACANEKEKEKEIVHKNYLRRNNYVRLSARARANSFDLARTTSARLSRVLFQQPVRVETLRRWRELIYAFAQGK